MPFALTFVGMLLIITGFQNTYQQFGQQVQSDFTGQNNFLYWFAAIIIVGALGYIKSLETFSRAFLTLIILALIVQAYKQNPNVFSDIGSGISSGSSTQVNPIGAPLPGAAASGGGTASGGNGIGSGLFDDFAHGFANGFSSSGGVSAVADFASSFL